MHGENRQLVTNQLTEIDTHLVELADVLGYFTG